MKKLIAWSVAGMAALATSAQADFFLHNTLDLSNTDLFGAALFDNESSLGTSPSAITTDGSSLFIAGFNGGTGTKAGVVRIEDPFSAAPTTTEFVSLETPGSRGFSGLAYDAATGSVLAAYDDGAADANGITAWHATTGGLLWAKEARGGSSVELDPGVGGSGRGAAWTTFGSGRRALQDIVTGNDIFTTGDGMIINGTGTGTFWRDLDFAPNGDIWLREGNNVIQGVRDGANSLSATNLVVDATEADFVNGQNIAYLDGLAGGDLVVYNDRSSTGLGQPFSFNVQLINTDGTAAAAQFLAGLGGALDPAFGLGSGYWDFEWDAANETLYVLDFSNRLVYQFKTNPIPEPTTALLLVLGGLLVRRR